MKNWEVAVTVIASCAVLAALAWLLWVTCTRFGCTW